MKKIFIIILLIVIVILAVIFVNFLEFKKNKIEVDKINNDYISYQDSDVQINIVVSAMNRAIDHNFKNKIPQDENNYFIENDNNSIKIYLETDSSDESSRVTIPMEELILGEKAGIEKVEEAFSDLLFEIKEIKYHEKTGQVKSIVFSSKSVIKISLEELNKK